MVPLVSQDLNLDNGCHEGHVTNESCVCDVMLHKQLAKNPPPPHFTLLRKRWRRRRRRSRRWIGRQRRRRIPRWRQGQRILSLFRRLRFHTRARPRACPRVRPHVRPRVRPHAGPCPCPRSDRSHGIVNNDR